VTTLAELETWVDESGLVSPQQRELRHFIDCLQSGEPVMIDGHAGVRAITLANSVLDSMRTGRPVFFNEDGSVAA
jgi:predicted dehydrogenase